MKNHKSNNNLQSYERRNAPQTIQATPISSRIVRYRVTTTISQQIFSVNDLNRGCGGLAAATATTAYPFCASVKLRKIEAWAPPSTVGTNTTVALQWDSGTVNEDFAGPSQIIGDTSVDPSRPAHIITRPPKNTSSAFWKSTYSANTNPICIISAVAGSVIDFHISYTLNDALGANTVVAVAAANAGGLYHQRILGGNGQVVSLNDIA